jgi:hypothetical protein
MSRYRIIIINMYSITLKLKEFWIKNALHRVFAGRIPILAASSHNASKISISLSCEGDSFLARSSSNFLESNILSQL